MPDTSFAALRARLESVPDSGHKPPNVDPRAAALAALIVVDFVSKEPARTRFARLSTKGELDPRHIEDLALAARSLLHLVPQLGRADAIARFLPVGAGVIDGGRALARTMTAVIAASSNEIADARPLVDYVSVGDDAFELAQNLRLLAAFYTDYDDVLAGAGGGYDAADAAKAREVAQEIASAVEALDTAEREEARKWVARAWALFETAYDEVARVGRFLFHRERPLFKFPPLLTVGTTSRRLRRADATHESRDAHDARPAPAAAPPPAPAPPARVVAPPEPRPGPPPLPPEGPDESDSYNDMIGEIAVEGVGETDPFPSGVKTVIPPILQVPQIPPIPQMPPPIPQIPPAAARPSLVDDEEIAEVRLDELVVEADAAPEPPPPAVAGKSGRGKSLPPAGKGGKGKSIPPTGKAKSLPPADKAVTSKGPAVAEATPRAAPPKAPVAAPKVPVTAPKPRVAAPAAKPASAAPPAVKPVAGGAKAQPKKPEPTKAEPAKPEPAKPEPVKPEPAKPEPAKPAPKVSPGAASSASAAGDDKPRRATNRFPVKLKLTVSSNDEVGTGEMENLSEKGAFIAMAVPRAPNTRLALTVSHPDTSEVLQIDAIVRWGRQARPNVALEAGVGVEFVEVTDAHRALIKKMIGR